MNKPMETIARISLGNLLPATIVKRRDRFTAVVKVGETEVLAHVADSGRLKELVYPGNIGMVRKAPVSSGASGSKAPRTTSYDLVLAGVGKDSWVSIDTRYPNKVFGFALVNRLIPELASYTEVRPEFTYVPRYDPESQADSVQAVSSRTDVPTGASTGVLALDLAGSQADTAASKKPRRVPRSRLDFLLRGEGLPPALVEVKSVSLCKDGRGLFPDAPTVRGTRHLRELIRAVSEGYRAYSVFIAQRSDIKTISPNRETDPDFADALKEAQESGVRLLGFGCTVTPEEIVFIPSGLPVVLDC